MLHSPLHLPNHNQGPIEKARIILKEQRMHLSGISCSPVAGFRAELLIDDGPISTELFVSRDYS